jgi:hypothetical protein
MVNYGKAISKKCGEIIVVEHVSLNKKVYEKKDAVTASMQSNEKAPLLEFLNRDKNCFFFRMDQIQKLINRFEGDQSEAYIGIMLGAHSKKMDDLGDAGCKMENNKEGSFTVVVGAYKSAGQNADKEIMFDLIESELENDKPLIQYPTGQIVKGVDPYKEGIQEGFDLKQITVKFPGV